MDALPRSIHYRIANRISALQENPRPAGTKKLKGGGGYRLRMGDYRVVYTVDDNSRTVIITVVAHRREAYR